MIVCQCTGASDRAIRRAVRAGATSVREVAQHCAAGAGCGGCRKTIADIIAVEQRGLARAAEVLPNASLASAG